MQRPRPARSSAARVLVRSRLGLLLAPVLLVACASVRAPLRWPWHEARGEVTGRILSGGSETSERSGGRVVVYLDPVVQGAEPAPPGPVATVRQRARHFTPSFLVVEAGRSVAFVNQDEIYHRLFSYSAPNAFELPLLANGQSAEVTLRTPGLVRFYCSLHPGESGTLFVAPSAWFATAQASGAYRIADVPPGRYRLHAWSEAGAPAARDVTVRPGVTASVDVSLSGERP